MMRPPLSLSLSISLTIGTVTTHLCDASIGAYTYSDSLTCPVGESNT
ncbi:hypothetical protein KIPB_016975, partial [Kipferlia bialata]|eukprot:g16975.t1